MDWRDAQFFKWIEQASFKLSLNRFSRKCLNFAPPQFLADYEKPLRHTFNCYAPYVHKAFLTFLHISPNFGIQNLIFADTFNCYLPSISFFAFLLSTVKFNKSNLFALVSCLHLVYIFCTNLAFTSTFIYFNTIKWLMSNNYNYFGIHFVYTVIQYVYSLFIELLNLASKLYIFKVHFPDYLRYLLYHKRSFANLLDLSNNCYAVFLYQYLKNIRAVTHNLFTFTGFLVLTNRRRTRSRNSILFFSNHIMFLSAAVSMTFY